MRPPAIQWYYKQWLGDDDVLGMEWDATAMHFHLLMMAIQQEPPGSIPNDMALIRRWLRCPPDDVWSRVRPQIFSAWRARGDRWVNEGLTTALERQARYRERYETGTKPERRRDEKTRRLYAIEEEKTLSTSSKSKPSTRLPEDFVPNQEHYALAVELGLNCEMEFQKFRDHFLGVHGTRGLKKDWHATLRKWLRSAENFGGGSSAGQVSKTEQRIAKNRATILAGLGYSENAGSCEPDLQDRVRAGGAKSLAESAGK